VHWTAVGWGCANGCRLDDFGRTDKDQIKPRPGSIISFQMLSMKRIG
jgi:hypothetical protein